MSTELLDSSPLGALELALQEERRALLDNDVLALLASTEAKVRALRQAEASPPDRSAAERVDALRQLNQANRRPAGPPPSRSGLALRHLGRVESTGTYNAAGLAGSRAQGRSLAVV